MLQLFRDAEGIEAILEPAQFTENLFPLPDDHPGMADLILVAKDGYGFDGKATGDEEITVSKGTPGTHGFLSKFDKMNASFIASGPGIKIGVPIETMQNIDVAPTIAKLFGVKLDHAAGRVLDEILAK